MHTYKYNLAIASCFRNELPFLEEWIKYHLFIGVQHFYLANNDIDKMPANRLLLPYIKKDIVTLLPECEIVFGQYNSVPKLLNKAKGESKWVAVIDLDEFIYPQRQNKDIYGELLLEYENKNVIALGINWATFGSANIVMHQSSVTQSYFKRAFKEDNCNKLIKFIVRPEHIKESRGHSFLFNRPAVVDTNYKSLVPDISGKYKSDVVNWQKLRLNHYPIKSIEDFMNKVKRGYMGKHWTSDHNDFWTKYLTEFNKNDQKDVGMLFATKALAS